jgi:cytochrome c oxidase assembly factor CtaG
VQAGCFVAGLLVLVGALLSPLDGLSDLLLSAHMTQHELLMLVAAPLLVIGRPLAPVLAGLPSRLRQAAVRGLRAPRILSAVRRATGPVRVWVVQMVVLWLWHVPALYEAALANEIVHWIQHASLLGAAGLFWWTLLQGRYGRAGYGVAALFVFATALQSSLLGALLTLSPEAWYPSHRLRSASGGLSPIQDQQLAGLMLWIPAGVLLAVLALALFATWLAEIERRMDRREAGGGGGVSQSRVG